ncbi:MAG: MFS transporter [Chloroflexia bacterium]
MHNALSGPTPPALGPEFRKLWASSAVSNLGDGVAVIAAPLLAVSLTRDPLLVAGLTFAQRAPWLLFPLISGALVDRLDRRQVLGFTAAFRSALLGLLGLAALADVMSIPLLYAVFFLLGTAETIFDPASVTVLPTIVARENLPRANARLTGTDGAQRFRGAAHRRVPLRRRRRLAFPRRGRSLRRCGCARTLTARFVPS